MQKTHDVLVIGAGPAGATAARLLAGAGWDVAMVEKSRFPRRKVCGEFISVTTQTLLSGNAFADLCRFHTGPDVKRVALFKQDVTVDAPMPSAAANEWGRAIAREHLELALVDAAAKEGAEVSQPWKLTQLQRDPEGFCATIASGDETRNLSARLVIAATGSWERTPFAEFAAGPHDPADLLAFKARFRNDSLPRGLMPLIAFPGGYGGMVHTGGGLLSLSFCIRRDALQRCRDARPGSSAAEAALQHIISTSAGVRSALRGAEQYGHWLAAGPIRPGIRTCYGNGIFFAGNLAGEAHPIVAEGISMAMQSGWLLSHILMQERDTVLTCGSSMRAGRIYRRAWRRAFAGRIRAAAFFARVAMRPGADTAARVAARFPQLLTYGAWLSGKAVRVG